VPLCGVETTAVCRGAVYSGATASACGECSLSAEGGKGKQR